MKNTKQKIRDKARQLFNEFGYDQVTIRQIAEELGMSSGNLNYHYRKREDILKALYFEMVETFDERAQNLDAIQFNCEYIFQTMKTSMDRMLEYRFFWTDLHHLLKYNIEIRYHFEKAKHIRLKGYQFLYANLTKKGLMRPIDFENEYEDLAERMLDYSNTWLYVSSIYEKIDSADLKVNKYAFQLLSMLYPYFTKDGKNDFKNHIKKSQ